MKRARLLGLCGLSLAACTGSSSSAPTASFGVPGGPHPPADFYDLPFPSDLRRAADGHVDLSAYSQANPLVNLYTEAMGKGLDGFGLNAAIVARFDMELDPASLPQTPAESLDDGASVYLVDVDPASPDAGKRWPLKVRFEPRKGQIIGTNWLSALPYPGFPLDEGTTYALVITDRVRTADGVALEPAPDFAAIAQAAVPGDAALAAAQTTYAKLWTYLDQPGGDERADVVSAAVFTTQHATEIMPLTRQKVWSLPAPTATGLARKSATAAYIEYQGTYPSPNFQAGTVPYKDDGGDFVLGPDGLPIVQRMENLRVSFAIPAEGTKPAGGWPIVLYAHGTGGSFTSYLNDGTAARLTAQGLAVISIDQVLHGPRNPGGNAEVDFFNFQNPQAARYNALQGAADDFTLLRLAQGLSFTDPVDNRKIDFDDAKIYFFGHSQGGLTGPPFLAAEPLVQGAVLSGAGALLYQALLTKTEPVDIATLVGTLIRDPNLDINDPVLALLQTWVERSDAANYGPLLARRPLAGLDGKPMARKPIFQTEGFTDHYAPNLTIEGFATSIGGDQVAPVKTPIDGLALRGRQTISAPVTNNLDGVTVVLLQYDQQGTSDGHFVVFDVPAAQQQSARFLGTLSATGTATVVQAQ
jgi:hypothetical protein